MRNLIECAKMYLPAFPCGDRDYGPYWRTLTAEGLSRIVNGIGPARWPPEARDAIAALIEKLWSWELRTDLVNDANVHDVGYEFGDKVEEDARFGRNMRKSVLRNTTVRSLLTRRGRARAAGALAVVVGMERIVRTFGDEAFAGDTGEV